jgi:hypothetical protein
MGQIRPVPIGAFTFIDCAVVTGRSSFSLHPQNNAARVDRTRYGWMCQRRRPMFIRR